VTDRNLRADQLAHAARAAGQPQPDLREQLPALMFNAVAPALGGFFVPLGRRKAVAEALLAVVQPELDRLAAEVDATVLVGWYCWRCAAINPAACRSDSVPILVPADWADDMVNEIAKREDEPS
jgi:hypothetical protein